MCTDGILLAVIHYKVSVVTKNDDRRATFDLSVRITWVFRLYTIPLATIKIQEGSYYNGSNTSKPPL